MDTLIAWLQFILSGTLVIVGGQALARNGKEFGDRRGLSEIWIGFIFLAAVTSLPELTTTIGAVAVAGAPVLALSDILGSNAFNLFIIAILNLAFVGAPVTARLRFSSFRDLFVVIAAMTVVLMGGMSFEAVRLSPGFFSVNPVSWLLLVLYLGGAWKLFRNERAGGKEPDLPPIPILGGEKKVSDKVLYLRLLAATAAVVAGGFWLANSGRLIAEITGWGEGFVGALFLALVTSLPELAVCLAAVRIGAAEMAVGNILGSNIFNLGIVFWADLAWRSGSVLDAAVPAVYEAGALSLALLAVAALALKFTPRRLTRRLSWDTLAILVIYLAGMYWLYILSRT